MQVTAGFWELTVLNVDKQQPSLHPVLSQLPRVSLRCPGPLGFLHQRHDGSNTCRSRLHPAEVLIRLGRGIAMARACFLFHRLALYNASAVAIQRTRRSNKANAAN
jgi:hypothetical protein